ncbi:major facilitator superfamily domain-containing protein [Cercophora newfieldiana]|uniref:Major facilitator superfamily domain-containing protein n=1 Tax=Cercophora newfieldiana TaxID=92897 RepID=A0AA39Y7X9_9PEZI|nr:major facilitator superfamily domain-containing protein [Cercophora newfieldiana]
MTVTTDETQPLLRSKTNGSTDGSAPIAGHHYTEVNIDTDTAACDAYLVDFDPQGDVDNPLEWPTPFKWGIVLLLALTGFTVTFTCIGVVPLADFIGRDLSGSASRSKSSSVLLVTIWELGEAAGPLLIAPLSEMYGRYPVINAANLLFILATIMAVTSQSVPVFVTARALTGLAVASNVLNPAIVGDMFVNEERGGAVSLIFLAPLIGGALGPAISSAVAERYGWRAVLWMSIAMASVCEVVFLTCFKETYKVAILRKRAEKLGVDVKGGKLVVEGGEQVKDGEGLRGLRDAVLRPARVLFGSGVLMAMSAFGSVVFSYYYVLSTTLAEILRDIYELDSITVGFCFISFSIGSVFSVLVCNRHLDKIYIKMKDDNKGVGLPEYRLPLVIVGAFCMPIVTAFYGWSAELRLGVQFTLLSAALMGGSLTLALVPMVAYIVDAFGLYAASATTGVIVTRCLMSTFLPLLTGPLVDSFGYGWAFTFFGGLALMLAPIPVMMLRYGAHWRRFSPYSRDQ